ncbi:MAG: enoyl-CoA hydratase/isomerase family protein [Deltaproteobacteria bacterium]|nr:enoyl-CoA hydratase/isomerase family protein [Deltaproteobacteria bacterium]
MLRLHTDKIIAEIEGQIGWITFNNPTKRNALSLEIWEALGSVLAEYQGHADVRVVVMKGAGDKAFVSGADISEFEKQRQNAAAAEHYANVSGHANKMLYELDKPLVAMIHGFCVGGGLGVALGADVRFATPDSKFGIPAAKLGLGYSFEGMKMLADLVGPSNAKDILFSGRLLDASEALSIGLVNQIVPAEELETAVREYATVVAGNAPLTVKSFKAGIREALKDPDRRDLVKLNEMIRHCFNSQDYAEGRKAFMEKRRPVFTGK